MTPCRCSIVSYSSEVGERFGQHDSKMPNERSHSEERTLESEDFLLREALGVVPDRVGAVDGGLRRRTLGLERVALDRETPEHDVGVGEISLESIELLPVARR